MALTKVSFSMIDGAFTNVLDFGAAGNGVADDTSPIQAAIDTVFAAGGGTVYFPAGTYLVTSLSLNWGASTTSMKFVGESQNSTEIRKTGAATSSVFILSAAASDGTYSEFADMNVVGSASASCFTTINLARNVWRNVSFSNGDIGVENRGSLINSFYDCNFLRNVIGYRARKNAGIYPNLVNIYGGCARGNSQWGFDIGDTNGLNMYGVDIETNGTPGGTGGGFITRSTCDDETGYSLINFNGVWFEGNYGTSIFSEACAGLTFSVTDTPVINSESGAAVTVAAIGTLILERVTIASSGDTVNSSAGTLVIRQSVINTLTNSSPRYLIENLATGAGTIQYEQKSPAGTFAVNGPSIKSASALVSAPTATATTMFTPSGGLGMYEVFACLPDAGSGTTYMATARIGYDRSAPARMGGENGSNLSITVSGANVQVTQTSGVTQSVYYTYQKIGD
jgi:hypothetical protein